MGTMNNTSKHSPIRRIAVAAIAALIPWLLIAATLTAGVGFVIATFSPSQPGGWHVLAWGSAFGVLVLVGHIIDRREARAAEDNLG